MKRLTIIACASWLAACASPPTTTPNTAPLEIGMTPGGASVALGVPLQLVGDRPGSKVYFAELPAGTPGFYGIDGLLYLQFRKGRLTGWSRDWHSGSHVWRL
jgi:hypothetical protein